MKKHLIPLLLALAVCAGLLGVPAFAAGDTSGTCGDGVLWSLSDDGGVLTISTDGTPGWHDMDNFYDPAHAVPDTPWHKAGAFNNLHSVVIEDGVTSIGSGAFSQCQNLTSITIPNSVTEIGECAFSGCTGLTSVTIPNSMTEIGEYAFSDCTGLTSVAIPSGVTEIGDYAFFRTNLTSIDIPKSVTKIGEKAFSGCDNLSEIAIPDSVTKIGRVAFEGTPWHERLTAGAGDFVMAGNVLLEYRGSGGEVTIPKGVTAIGDQAFSHCESLTGVTIPKGVTAIGKNAFTGCTNLTEVSIPSTVTTVGIDFLVMTHAFSNTPWFERQMEEPGDFIMVGGVLYTYKGDKSSVTVPDGVSTIGGLAFARIFWPHPVDRVDVTSVTLPNSVTKIDDGAFIGCDLTSITIPGSVTEIGAWAFDSCKSLTSITIPDSVTRIGSNAFQSCKNLTSVTIWGSATRIGDAFYNCDNLTIHCYEGSRAESYAIANDIPYVAQPKPRAKPPVPIVAVVIAAVVIAGVVVVIVLKKKKPAAPVSAGGNVPTQVPPVQRPPVQVPPAPQPPAAPPQQSTTAPNFCPNCGQKLDPDAKFCSNCGKSLIK